MEKQALLQKKIWAVVGDVANKEKVAHRIVGVLQEKGYNAYGVHPKGGDGIYPSLTALPIKPDVLCLVINPVAGPSYLREAQALGIQYIWIQPGADPEEILSLCRELKLEYVQACVLVETRSH